MTVERHWKQVQRNAVAIMLNVFTVMLKEFCHCDWYCSCKMHNVERCQIKMRMVLILITEVYIYIYSCNNTILCA